MAASGGGSGFGTHWRVGGGTGGEGVGQPHWRPVQNFLSTAVSGGSTGACGVGVYCGPGLDCLHIELSYKQSN